VYSIVGTVHSEVVRASLEEVASTGRAENNVAGLMRAALVGDTNALSALLDRGVAVNSKDRYGRTPLIEAVFGGNPDTVRELVRRGADVNAQDIDGWTALMEAATKARPEIIRILLEHQANPSIKNKNGSTALRMTSRHHPEVVRLLKDAGAH
jgi:ankyrin repeat protein